MSGDDGTEGLRATLAGALRTHGRLVVSRVRTRRLSDLLPPGGFAEAPVVWGRTMWDLTSGACVVEQPNGLGLVERGYPDDAVVVSTMGSHSVQLAAGDPAGRRGLAGRLRGRLLQLSGVHPATRQVESARFVLLFPYAPETVASIPAPRGMHVAPLGSQLPEYAGGVRFEVGEEAVESEVVAYAAAVADHVAQAEGKQ